MANKKELEMISEMILNDEQFRKAFSADPIKAAQSISVNLTKEDLANIKISIESMPTRQSKAYFGAVK